MTPGRSAKISRIKFIRLLIVLGGILAGQFILYGPSLTGQRVLLPLDILAESSVYLPVTPELPHNAILNDLVLQWEPARQFAISEIHAGRLPMWNPYQYAGCPVIWPKFSPFLLLECCTRSPLILAWTQLLAAVIAGLGIYAFLRRSLRVTFWAAAIPAWCYPVTAFFVFWQGYPTSWPVYWLPWLLLAVDRTIRAGNRLAPITLSIVTALVLVSGALDIAGQVLLVSGLYATWCFFNDYKKELPGGHARRVIAMLTAAWLLGFLLSGPYLLPTLEYLRTGERMERRAAGVEERPPAGLAALPQLVLPEMYGSTMQGSLRISPEDQPESSAAGYAGMLATLFVAPLAWRSRRHRSIALFWLLLGFFGASWCLDVPGLVPLLRLPGLNMMSHNRLVFATSFSILALAAVGLDSLARRKVRRRRWFLIPAACLALLLAWCFHRAQVLPEPVATQLGSIVSQHRAVQWVQSFDDVIQVQRWFAFSYGVSMIPCVIGLIAWLLLWFRPRWPKWCIPLAGLLMLADLLWCAHGRSSQCNISLYYPRIPALDQIRQLNPGRVIGVNCLPPALAELNGLRDIQGYDAVDPARLMDLMAIALEPDYQGTLPFAETEWFLPRRILSADSIRLPPSLDMLGVRYAIYRGQPPPGIKPIAQSPDYWVALNRYALPRAFIPRHVEMVSDASEELQRMGSPQFDPREVAYVEAPLDLTDSSNGRVDITSEIPTDIILSVQTTTPGLVVLADLWDKGWKAYVNGRPASILLVNHAVRGVVVPAGQTQLEFRYEPASFRLGLQLAGVSAAILMIWSMLSVLGRRNRGSKSSALLRHRLLRESSGGAGGFPFGLNHGHDASRDGGGF